MNHIPHEDLRRIAEAATPKHLPSVSSMLHMEDALRAYRASTPPRVTLGLLDSLAAKDAEIAEGRAAFASLMDERNRLAVKCHDLELASLRAALNDSREGK